MVGFSGPEIITDGLVLALDAGNTRSYPGSGTAWTTLVNSTVTSLVNSPSYSSTSAGSLNFNGINQYAVTNNAVITSPTAISISIWVRPISDGVIICCLNSSNINFSYHHAAVLVNSSGLCQMALWHGGLTNNLSSTIAFNQWHNLVLMSNGTATTGYINGEFIGTIASTWQPPSSLFLGIMAEDFTSMGVTTYGDGAVGNLLVYNRALTAIEVQQNFNAYRGRYDR